MIVAVVSAFVILHTPFYALEIAQLKQKYGKSGREKTAKWHRYAFVYSNLLAQSAIYVNSALNPLLYFILNENFREYF